MSLINKNDKIFIAGSEGMVGSAIKRNLSFNDYHNLLCPTRIELDLTNNKNVEDWFTNNKPEIVIIAAAKVGGIFANNSYPSDFLLDNLKIQNNLIETSWKNDIKRLLFLGSSCIYPKNTSQPIKEDSLLDGDLEKTNEWYAIAKICGIKLCQALRKQYDFDAISLMPTNLYGKGDNYHQTNSHVLPGLLDRFHKHAQAKKDSIECWGTGRPRREFMHVDDLAQACTFALEKWDPKAKNAPLDKDGSPLTLLNVGTSKDISIKELAELIKDLTSYKGRIIWDTSKPDGTFQKLLDVSKMNKLGWKAKIDLEKGLKITYEDYLRDLKKNNLRRK